jgi:hypothetical protein
MDLRRIVWERVDWIHLAQNRDERQAVVKMGMNLWISCKAGHYLTSLVIISFSGRTPLHGGSFILNTMNQKIIQTNNNRPYIGL